MLHDLRRSVVTHISEGGFAQPHVIEAIVNHISAPKRASPTYYRARRPRMRKLGLYSITSSARASNDTGMSRPSALAVERLTTNSYLVGFCTGSSVSFSPFRIRSI